MINYLITISTTSAYVFFTRNMSIRLIESKNYIFPITSSTFERWQIICDSKRGYIYFESSPHFNIYRSKLPTNEIPTITINADVLWWNHEMNIISSRAHSVNFSKYTNTCTWVFAMGEFAPYVIDKITMKRWSFRYWIIRMKENFRRLILYDLIILNRAIYFILKLGITNN